MERDDACARSVCSAPAKPALAPAPSVRWRRGRIGILLGGIQLLPTADAVAHSVRMAVSRDFALTLLAAPDQSAPAVVAVLLRATAPTACASRCGSTSSASTRARSSRLRSSGSGSDVALCPNGGGSLLPSRFSPQSRCSLRLAATAAWPSCSRISRCSRPFALRSAISCWCIRVRDPGGDHVRRSAGHR